MARINGNGNSNGKPGRRIIVRRSGIHGKGVFALTDIPKGTRLMEYVGERISHKEADRRYAAEHEHSPHTMLFAVDDKVVIDATQWGNSSRFINHSCTPNCWFEVVDKTIWIRAGRNIRRGEELTYNYSIIGEKTTPCRCRPGCPNRI